LILRPAAASSRSLLLPGTSAPKPGRPNPDIPAPVAATVMLARPKAAAKAESYSVSVRNIPVQDLLFALARDAKLNIDIHPGINGIVTINAIDQTLQQILTRIAKQVDMRWELDGPNLVVMPDSPFLRNYKVDYVNMSRDVSGTVSINTQIASTSTSAAGGAASGGGNNSSTSVKSTAQNNFWQSLDKNLKDILRESDKILPEGSSETVIERSDQQATTGTGAQNTAKARRAGRAVRPPALPAARIRQACSNKAPPSSSAPPSAKPPRSSSIRKRVSWWFAPHRGSTKRSRNTWTWC
jgi:hypothetical protein